MKEYVLAFIFDTKLNQILLIKKNRPDYQAGLLNGIGGKIEPNETPIKAVHREVFEETNLNIPENDFVSFGEFSNEFFKIYLFFTKINNINQAISKTDEEVKVIEINEYMFKQYKFVQNFELLFDTAFKKVTNG